MYSEWWPTGCDGNGLRRTDGQAQGQTGEERLLKKAPTKTAGEFQ